MTKFESMFKLPNAPNPDLRLLRSGSPLAPRPSPLGFTLIEMLTAVALLVIVLGLMVSLARYVRNRSATQLTREILANLNDAMSRYVEQYSAKPHVPVLVESVDLPDEQTLLRSAEL